MSLRIVTVSSDVLSAVGPLVATYFAHFLTATSSFLSTACIAEFLTTVFQPLRHEMVQAYGRLVHFLCHKDRPAAGSCPRELVSTQLTRILRQRMNFAGGVMRIRHPQNNSPFLIRIT
ncbi:MAG TPA: hypothetical protein VF075_10220 [Pyrinomonadaceae bacterium]